MGVSNGENRPSLRRVLGLWDSVAIIVGIIIGSGIFFAPRTIAAELPNSGAIMLVWLLGGLTALCGALTYAELGSAWPHTGGLYIFIREAFGKLPSFLFGWCQLWVARPASVAAVAVVFAKYLAFFIPVPESGVKLFAVAAILAVSIVNYLGVRLTSVVQNVLTVVKVAAVFLIAAAGLLLYSPVSSVGVGESAPVLFHMDFWSSFGLALVAVFWTCDGWNEITYVAGEVKEPERTVPKALLIGTLLVLFLYALINASFLRVLGVAGIANSDRVAADAMIRILGPLGGSLTALVVIISTLGTLNGATLTGPRIFFAMAVDGLFFPWARKVDSEYRTPSTAIALQALMAIPLVITWTFEQLATYFVFISLIFYALAALAVFHLRRSPKAPRPEYRTWGYPFTPIFFLLVSGGILANTLVRAPLQAIVALAILGAGVPAFYVWKRRWGAITSSVRMFF